MVFLVGMKFLEKERDKDDHMLESGGNQQEPLLRVLEMEGPE